MKVNFTKNIYYFFFNYFRSMNSKISKRRLRPSATQSSPSCTKLLVVQEVCPAVCLVVCPVACLVPLELVVLLVQDPDPLSKKSTKSEIKNTCIYNKPKHFMISLATTTNKRNCNQPALKYNTCESTVLNLELFHFFRSGGLNTELS